MTISARILDAAETQLAATIDGTEWSGICCHRSGSAIVIDGDGQIPDTVKKWIEAGGVPTPYAAPAITAAQVVAERERRLSLGFNYNFGDARGIHRIGTTEADLVGWDDVTKATQAMVALGAGSQTLAVVTDTGPVTITALEWQQILLAAAAHRQPIWTKSFAIQALNPIPADYAADARWA